MKARKQVADDSGRLAAWEEGFGYFVDIRTRERWAKGA
jgi:hypothetical protein